MSRDSRISIECNETENVDISLGLLQFPVEVIEQVTHWHYYFIGMTGLVD